MCPPLMMLSSRIHQLPDVTQVNIPTQHVNGPTALTRKARPHRAMYQRLVARTERQDRPIGSVEPDADALGSETVWQLAAQGSTCHCEATAKLLLRP
jgi:hypothetical protein